MDVYCEGFPILIPTTSSRTWKIYRDFIFFIDGVQYVIPKDFETDLIPAIWPITLLLPWWGRYGVGSIVHNFCYRTHLFDRKKCDDIFRKIMKMYNSREWEIFIIYYSFRLVGWTVYNKYKQ